MMSTVPAVSSGMRVCGVSGTNLTSILSSFSSSLAASTILRQMSIE